MSRRLTKRITSDENNMENMKKACEIKEGEYVKLTDYVFEVSQVDILENNVCLVDKYADDHYVKKDQMVEVVQMISDSDNENDSEV